MFFMMGITDGRKELNYSQTEICSVCGCYGRYQVFMTYTVYRSITVFYSMFQVESALLCTDKLL